MHHPLCLSKIFIYFLKYIPPPPLFILGVTRTKPTMFSGVSCRQLTKKNIYIFLNTNFLLLVGFLFILLKIYDLKKKEEWNGDVENCESLYSQWGALDWNDIFFQLKPEVVLEVVDPTWRSSSFFSFRFYFVCFLWRVYIYHLVLPLIGRRGRLVRVDTKP